MKQKLETIIKYLIGDERGRASPDTTHISGQFREGEEDSGAVARNLNAAFLIALAGETHPLHEKARTYLSTLSSHPSWKTAALFYREGVALIHDEIVNQCYDNEYFEQDLTALSAWLGNPDSTRNTAKTVESIQRVFFPEGVALCEDRGEKIGALRKKRKITITRLNPSPVVDPAREILFTSNILVTVPPGSKEIDDLSVSLYLKEALKRIVQEEQIYWYDHPVPMGISPEHNEVLYGLEGLDKAIRFEKQRGTIDRDARASCLLSVSVTHKGLQRIVKEYLEDELKKEKNIEHVDVYVMSEADSIKIIEEILIPAAKQYMGAAEFSNLYSVFGVDGEYGRHYSFLKAIAAFWQVFFNPAVKGTFKFDLDQVFPQDELVAQGGHSAFEHFRTPLWGAEGIDHEGRAVELGMIAGALVNQKDIGDSLFTPDVSFPCSPVKAEDLIFFSSLPQALSTEAEMMTRYGDRDMDGIHHCIQRIHVTGGTCGILIDALRKYKPFTPTFIGRAEDQAYLLSVLFEGDQHMLRYVHKDGLIMRHDKETFAGEAIKMAAAGKMVGEYIRMLMFSYYVRALPWTLKEIKNTIDPFTGCFVSQIPLTVVHLRFALKAASFFQEHSDEKNLEGHEFLRIGVRRLRETIQKLTGEPNPLLEHYSKEKEGWNMFYEILEKTERGIKEADPFALALKEKAAVLLKNGKIRGNEHVPRKS